MDTRNNDLLTKIFFRACDLDDEARAKYIEQACTGNPALKTQVEKMIAEGENVSRSDNTHIVEKVVQKSAQSFVDRHEAPPEHVGPYSIIREIGEGGMSVVYEAEQHQPVKRKVALKVIRPGMDTRDVIARFESERQALAVMDHVNIAKIFGGGTTPEGRPYFVMELVSGEPITDYCDKHQLNIRQRLEIFCHVCAAVQHAHQKGVVHRDLKPSNILIGQQDGEPLVKVIDFGIAKALDITLNDDPTETRYGQVIGTPTHMSPEQATGNVHDVDTRTDIYSLGVVLFQLLVGVLPYEIDMRSGQSISASIGHSSVTRPSFKLKESASQATKIATDRQTDASRLVRLIARDLDWIVLKAMEIERDRRYQTVNALVVDINHFLQDRPIMARPPSTAYVMSRFVRRNRKTVIAATITIMALLSGITMATIGLVRATKAEQEARLDQRTAEITQEFLISTFTVVDPATSLGQRISASDLLKRGAARIEVELAGEPRVQGELLQTMGRAFENLALYKEAEPMLRQSVERRIQAHGEQHAKVAEAYQELGEVLWRIGQYDESKQAIEKADRIFTANFGSHDTSVAVNRSKLGMAYLKSGDYSQAEELFIQSQTIYEDLGLQHTNNYADNLNDLGGVKLRLGEVKEASSYFLEALEIWHKNYGDIHPDIALVMTNLGTMLANEGKFDEAEKFYQDALTMRRRLYEDNNHSDIAVSLNNLAMMYWRQDNAQKAEPLFRESIEIRRKVYGEMSPSVATGLNNLAGVLRAKGELDQAEATYRESLNVRVVLQGDSHPSVAITQTNLAETLAEQGRYDQALREINAAIITLQASLGPIHWRVFNAQSVKGITLAGLGRYREAEPLLIEAFTQIREARGDKNIYTQRCLDRVLQLYQQWGRQDQLHAYEELRVTLTDSE